MSVKKRVGTIPANHSLKSGKTVVCSTGKPGKRILHESTSTPEDRTCFDASSYREQYERHKRLQQGLARGSKDQYQVYMRKKQQEYYDSLQRKNDETD